jgi:hypothetical protein
MHLALASSAPLPGLGASAGAEALIELADHYGLPRAWLPGRPHNQ